MVRWGTRAGDRSCRSRNLHFRRLCWLWEQERDEWIRRRRSGMKIPFVGQPRKIWCNHVRLRSSVIADVRGRCWIFTAKTTSLLLSLSTSLLSMLLLSSSSFAVVVAMISDLDLVFVLGARSNFSNSTQFNLNLTVGGRIFRIYWRFAKKCKVHRHTHTANKKSEKSQPHIHHHLLRGKTSQILHRSRHFHALFVSRHYVWPSRGVGMRENGLTEATLQEKARKICRRIDVVCTPFMSLSYLAYHWCPLYVIIVNRYHELMYLKFWKEWGSSWQR